MKFDSTYWDLLCLISHGGAQHPACNILFLMNPPAHHTLASFIITHFPTWFYRLIKHVYFLHRDTDTFIFRTGTEETWYMVYLCWWFCLQNFTAFLFIPNCLAYLFCIYLQTTAQHFCSKRRSYQIAQRCCWWLLQEFVCVCLKQLSAAGGDRLVCSLDESPEFQTDGSTHAP